VSQDHATAMELNQAREVAANAQAELEALEVQFVRQKKVLKIQALGTTTLVAAPRKRKALAAVSQQRQIFIL
jgi:hypothetical protein